MTDLATRTSPETATPSDPSLAGLFDDPGGESDVGEMGPSEPSGGLDFLFCLVPAVAAVALCTWFRPLLTSGLWWDEQWRAYHVVLPGLHLDLSGTYAPTSPAWLLIEKFAVVLLGLKEWVLRTPGIVAWVLIGPLTYRLCRRVMGRAASLVAGTALGATPAILYFGTELKPYVTETLCTVAIILAWTRAHEKEGTRRFVWYGVIALVSLVSVPAVFVVVPLLAVDAVRAVRRWRIDSRESRLQLAVVAATSAAVVVPLALTVLPQPAGAEYSYFHFLHGGLGEALLTAVRQIGAFLAAAWTSASLIKTDTRSVPLAFPSHPLFACAEWGIAVLVVIGGWHLRHSIVGIGLTSVFVGGLAFQVVTSLLHLWPLGIARVNLFLIPLVYVLTVAGLVCAWHAVRNGLMPALRAAALGVLCAGILLLGGIVVQDGVTTGALHADLPMHRWAEDLRTVVADARDDSGAGTIAVVQMDGAQSGFFAEPKGAPRGLGWTVYMDHYSYSEPVGNRIPLSRTFFADIALRSYTGLHDFLADHLLATTVVEYAALGNIAMGEAGGARVAKTIRSFGFEPYSTTTYKDSGQLTVWHR
jgi:hypothetical protein